MTKEREKVELAQLAALNRLLAAIVPGNVFYSRKLTVQSVSSLTEFRERVPFTTKPEIVEDQLSHPPYGTNRTFPLERYTRLHQTSGTTGEPLRWLDTPESWAWMIGCWRIVLQAAGVGAGDRAMFAFSFGPFLGFWTAFEAALEAGMLCIPGGGLSSAIRLQAMAANRVTVLFCTPTYAMRLGEVAKEEKMDVRQFGLRRIIVAGEAGGSIPAVRERMEALWPGAKVFDHHGMTEIGPVTFECPDKPGTLCVMESAYVAEVIDPVTCREVSEGETGELVLTNLGRVGSPLLRYRTGDLVRKRYVKSELAFEGGILGRVDDMVIVRGVNLYPSAIEKIVRQWPDVAEYRVEIRQVRQMNEMELIIEPVRDCKGAAGLAGKVEAELGKAFGLRVPVRLAEPGSLPRFELKSKRWNRV
jgi:phenylacetate-CoA ligase